MTREEANEILHYVAEELLAPLAFDDRPASEVWQELIGTPFNKVCKIVNEKVEKNS